MAFHPSWEQLAASAHKFFLSARIGSFQTEIFTKKFLERKIIIFPHPHHLENFKILNTALFEGELTRDQLPRVRRGIRDILSENNSVKPEDVAAAEDFSSALYTHRPNRPRR